MHEVQALRGAPAERRANALLRRGSRSLRGLTWSLVGWVGLIALTFDVKDIVLSALWSNRINWPAVLTNTLAGLFILIFAIVLTNVASRGLPRPVPLALAVFTGSALAFLVQAWILDMRVLSFGDLFFRLRINLLEWGLVVVAYYFIERSERRAAGLRAAELERHRIEAQMLEARLQVMQAQVEPHFLFNTLAHVQRLYQTDPGRGRSMLNNFCSYLRAALPHMRGSTSTLGREVELARAYLGTQRIRMGRRLRFDVTIPDHLSAASFPPMMLLSLVENAIKHGLNARREGGRIEIGALADDSILCVTVSDTGIGLSKSELGAGDGVGLSNIRSRLATLYDGRARLVLRNNSPHGVVATLEVPLRMQAAADVRDDAPQAPGMVHASAQGSHA